MRRSVRQAEQRHRSRRPHKRFHAPDERVVTIQPIIERYPSGALKSAMVDGERLHFQDGMWLRMSGGHRVDE